MHSFPGEQDLRPLLPRSPEDHRQARITGPGCKASREAARILEEEGFSAVRRYKGGLKGWLEAGNEVERG